jgi:hypothetical protein
LQLLEGTLFERPFVAVFRRPGTTMSLDDMLK